MKGQEFLDWLVQKQQCETTPITGKNITGFSVKIVCKRTNRYYYFSGPFGHTQIPSDVVRDICDTLWVPYPDEVK